MKNTYQLHISYPAHVSLYHLTSAVEAIKGVKIQRLNLTKRGKRIVGKMAVEVPAQLTFDWVVDRIQQNREISIVEDIF